MMLKSGSTGHGVLVLQRRLKAVGFDPTPRGGVFGSKADAALRAFQDKPAAADDGPAPR